MMHYTHFPLLALAAADVTISFNDVIKAAGFLISGGLLTLIGVILTNKKDNDTNKRDNRSEIEKTYTENVKELMDSQQEFTEKINARLSHVEQQLREKDDSIKLH